MEAKKVKLTSVRVESLPLVEKGQKIYWDAELRCFGVKVGTNIKTYIVQRRVDGRNKQVKIARADEITAEKARSEAYELLTQMRQGTDPIAKRREAAIRGKTFGEAFDEFYESRKSRLKPSTLRGYQDLMKNHLSDWKRKELSSIARDDICRRHEHICADGKKGAADHCMRLVSAIFNYEIAEGLSLQNPVQILKSRSMWGKKIRRENWIKDTQLRPWYKAVRNLNNQTIKDYLIFLLYSGLRKNEGLKLRWDDVDMKNKSFTVQDTKNHEPLHLPLSEQLYTIIKRRRATRSLKNPYVFNGEGKEGHLVEPGHSVDIVINESKVHFILHDLRRSFITYAERLDISSYAIKRLVNHKRVTGDVTAGYIGADVERLRDPMQRIANEIDSHMLKKPVSDKSIALAASAARLPPPKISSSHEESNPASKMLPVALMRPVPLLPRLPVADPSI